MTNIKHYETQVCVYSNMNMISFLYILRCVSHALNSVAITCRYLLGSTVHPLFFLLLCILNPMQFIFIYFIQKQHEVH